MSNLPQPEGRSDSSFAGDTEVVPLPQLTLIGGGLDGPTLPVEAGAGELPLPDYSHDLRRAEVARTDPDAFEALHEEFAGLIRFKAANYFLPGGESQDLIQEGTIGFYKGVLNYDGQKSSLRNFLDLCISRNVITAVKAATRGKHGPLNDAISLRSVPPSLGAG